MVGSCDLADEKDSGISQVSADGLGPGSVEDKLALLELNSGLDTSANGGARVNGRGRGPQAMDDMLYGSNDNITIGKILSITTILFNISSLVIVALE